MCGLRAEGAEDCCGSCHSRKLTSSCVSWVQWVLSVFGGALGREKRAQRADTSQVGCASSWQGLLSSVSQKSSPSRSKKQLSKGEAVCLSAGEAGGRKNPGFQSKRGQMCPHSASNVIPDTGVTLAQLYCLLPSPVPLPLMLCTVTYVWLKCFFPKSWS